MMSSNKLYKIMKLALLSLIGMASLGCSSLNAAPSEEMKRTYTAAIDEGQYSFILKENSLYSLDEKGEAAASLLFNNVLDVKFYNLDFKGNDELILLTLADDKDLKEPYKGAHNQYGEQLRIYDLSLQQGKPKASLKYANDMKSIHPWKIDTGKMDGRNLYGNIFVGVYKDTRFYKEVINRPFFLTWNGTFIERKWTGSYLSTNEYVDLIFVDFTGDGYDEVAALEKRKDGRYQVSLYKWLTFGFEYLMTSKESYEGAQTLKCMPAQSAGEAPIILVEDKNGCETVRFK